MQRQVRELACPLALAHIPSVALVTRFCQLPYTSRMTKMTVEYAAA